MADLAATGGLRILSSPEGADVKIDGELIGKTPVQRDAVPSGDHIVEFKMPGFFDHKETMKIEGGREKVFSVDLKALPSGPSPEQVAASARWRCRRSAPRQPGGRRDRRLRRRLSLLRHGRG